MVNLIAAVESRDLDRLKRALATGADVNTRESFSGVTPLMTASFNGLADAVVLLVKHGADVDARDNDGLTPLRRAVDIESVEIARYLLDAGSDANGADSEGDTPLMVVRSLELAELLLAHGADVNLANRNGATALHRLALGLTETPKFFRIEPEVHAKWCESGMAILRLLIENGADPTREDAWGNRPVDLAREHGAIRDAVDLLSIHE